TRLTARWIRSDFGLGCRAAAEHLVEADDRGRAFDLTVWIAGKRLTNEIGVVERLMYLADSGDLKPAHDSNQLGVPLRSIEKTFGRNGEEAFWRKGELVAIGRGDHGG